MTAAKVMDIISKLPGCDGQAADAVSAYTQVNVGGCSKMDAGLRFDGLPALELWDLIVALLGNVSRVSDGSGKPESVVHKRHKPHKKIDVMEDIDSVPSNVHSARQEALLYVFSGHRVAQVVRVSHLIHA